MKAPPTFKPRQYRTLKERKQAHDQSRGTASERGYNWKWQKARAIWLMDYPLCALCEAKGLLKAASVVDHITPHRGNDTLFWDTTNWQSLCVVCHNIKTGKGL